MGGAKLDRDVTRAGGTYQIPKIFFRWGRSAICRRAFAPGPKMFAIADQRGLVDVVRAAMRALNGGAVAGNRYSAQSPGPSVPGIAVMARRKRHEEFQSRAAR